MAKLQGARPAGYSILYDQCSQEVEDKLKASENFAEVGVNKEFTV